MPSCLSVSPRTCPAGRAACARGAWLGRLVLRDA